MSWRLARLAVATLLAFFAGAAGAQSFATKPITLIVPWSPGGSTDAHLRRFAEIAPRHVGQYRSNEDYQKWAAETFKSERATIERVGLLAK